MVKKLCERFNYHLLMLFLIRVEGRGRMLKLTPAQTHITPSKKIRSVITNILRTHLRDSQRIYVSQKVYTFRKYFK